MFRSAARVIVLPAILAACTPTPPAPPAVRNGTTVQASFGKTWESVIDVFGERNISIKTLDRASGLIAAEPMTVGTKDETLADCGKDWAGTVMYPTNATWNVLVRGDSTRSTIKANVRFIRVGSARGFGNTNQVTEDCSTRGAWETAFEAQIKERAEKKAVTGGQ